MSKSIGEALKEERRSLGLTQEQFIKGIISESLYSKVERGKNEIVAVDLLKILAANNISEEEFLSKLNVKENNNLEEDLKVQLLNAYSIHDKKKISMLVQKIQNAAMDENTKILARLIDAVVNNKINDLTQREITQIKRKFFEVDDWTKNITTLQLFCNSMLLFDFDELVLFVKKLEKTCKGKLMKLPFNTQKIIASICINYFHNCYTNDCGQDASYGYEIIGELANIPDLGIYVIVTNFYKAYFQGNKKQSQQILDFLNQNGLSEISSRLP